MTIPWYPSPVNGDLAPPTVAPNTPQWIWDASVGAWNLIASGGQPSTAALIFGEIVMDSFVNPGLTVPPTSYIFTKV